MSGSASDSPTSSRMAMAWLPSARTTTVPRRCSTSSAVRPPGRLPVRSQTTASGSAWTGTAGARSAGRDAGVALAMKRMICVAADQRPVPRAGDHRRVRAVG